jgi:hypothetical protein
MLTIPTTTEDVITAIKHATGWERAALVAAVVRMQPTRGGDRRSARFHDAETTVAFADRGIPGLTSDTTVRRYIRRWLAITGRYPRPGEHVTLPLTPWGRVTSSHK